MSSLVVSAQIFKFAGNGLMNGALALPLSCLVYVIFPAGLDCAHCAGWDWLDSVYWWMGLPYQCCVSTVSIVMFISHKMALYIVLC